MALPETILDLLLKPQGMVLFVASSALVTGLVVEIILKLLTRWVATRDWWPRALPLQKALMMSFGMSEAACNDFALRQSYSYCIALCTHHLICGLMVVPVVAYGWAGSQSAGQACFVVAALMTVSVDMYDWLLFESVGQKLFGGGEKSPVQTFMVLGVLHHTPTLMIVCPWVMYYPDLESFHVVAMALLLAACICFTAGAYKLTLDLTKVSEWYQFKFIVALQTVTVLYCRSYVWFLHIYQVLGQFWVDGNMALFWAGCAATALMSLFDATRILDAVWGAAKWLPRGMREVKSDSRDRPCGGHSDGHPREARRICAAGASKGAPDLGGRRTTGLPLLARAAHSEARATHAADVPKGGLDLGEKRAAGVPSLAREAAARSAGKTKQEHTGARSRQAEEEEARASAREAAREEDRGTGARPQQAEEEEEEEGARASAGEAAQQEGQETEMALVADRVARDCTGPQREARKETLELDLLRRMLSGRVREEAARREAAEEAHRERGRARQNQERAQQRTQAEAPVRRAGEEHPRRSSGRAGRAECRTDSWADGPPADAPITTSAATPAAPRQSERSVAVPRALNLSEL